MALTPKDVALLHADLKKLLEVWMRIKVAIQKAFGKGPFEKDQEQAFLNLKSDLSSMYRCVGEQLPKDLQFDGDSMIELMKNATSLQYVNTLPEGEKRILISKWHKIYTMMTRTFGALEIINEGYYPRLHRHLLGSKKKTKGKPRRARA